MMFLIVAGSLYLVVGFVARDVNLVLADPIFILNLKDVLNSELRYLQNEMGIILDVNTDELLPTPCFPNNADWFEEYKSFATEDGGCTQLSNISAVRFDGNMDEFAVFAGPYAALVNDWVLTIMLCLYVSRSQATKSK
jgi:hypothetical protein